MLGFSHYHVVDGRVTLFTMDTCENCKEKIQAANALGGVVKDIPTYEKMGLKKADELPEEGYYSDELDGEACYNCNG